MPVFACGAGEQHLSNTPSTWCPRPPRSAQGKLGVTGAGEGGGIWGACVFPGTPQLQAGHGAFRSVPHPGAEAAQGRISSSSPVGRASHHLPPFTAGGGKRFLWRSLKYLVLPAPTQPPTRRHAWLANLALEKRGGPSTVPLPERGEVIDKHRPKMCCRVLYVRELYVIEYLQADFYFSVSQIMM